MRFSRLAILCVGIGAIAGCRASDVSDPSLPALGSVRFINAVADSSGVDIRMIDQIEFSGVANNLLFRQGTEHQPVEAKARHIRVFATSTNPAVTSNFLLDTTIAITANSRQTLLLTGSARAKSTLKFVVINDIPATIPAAGQIGVRVVNVTAGAIDGYVVAAPTDAIAAPATAANVSAIGASAYTIRAMGTAALRVTDAGSATVNASAAGPVAASLAGALPAAGVNSEKTVFSVFYFPRSVAGSTAPAAFTTPGIIWFVDRNPADQ